MADLDPTSTTPQSHLGAEILWQLGDYQILRVLGEGGMGTVYLAQQQEPNRRQVAIKLIRWRPARQLKARFEAERRTLALMSHPNVAQVLEAGEEDGNPFLVMELVAGEPITEYCNRHRLTLRQRLELFGQACAGVQHAYCKGVIHRDLKPSNVLVGGDPEAPVLKIIDFGIAEIAQDAESLDDLIRQEQEVGTVGYMSPEQIKQLDDIDTRSDVYALGLILYQLLIDEHPFDAGTMAGFVRRILTEVTLPPSSRFRDLDEAAFARRSDPAALARALSGDLDAVALKALAHDREQRYGSVSELAADLELYLADRPVTARRATHWHRLRKLVRRHRGKAVTAALLVLALSVGNAGTF